MGYSRSGIWHVIEAMPAGYRKSDAKPFSVNYSKNNKEVSRDMHGCLTSGRLQRSLKLSAGMGNRYYVSILH